MFKIDIWCDEILIVSVFENVFCNVIKYVEYIILINLEEFDVIYMIICDDGKGVDEVNFVRLCEFFFC